MTDLPASPAAAAAATTTTTTTTTTTKTNALCVGTATPLSGSGVSSTSEEIPSFRSARRVRISAETSSPQRSARHRSGSHGHSSLPSATSTIPIAMITANLAALSLEQNVEGKEPPEQEVPALLISPDASRVASQRPSPTPSHTSPQASSAFLGKRSVSGTTSTSESSDEKSVSASAATWGTSLDVSNLLSSWGRFCSKYLAVKELFNFCFELNSYVPHKLVMNFCHLLQILQLLGLVFLSTMPNSSLYTNSGDLLIVMKILCIFTRWLPGTIKFITLYCFAAVTASVFILLLLFSFSMHVHFAKQMHLPKYSKKILCFFYHCGADILIFPALCSWMPFLLGKRTLGVFAPEANVKIILSMAIICWLGVISLGVVVVSKFFILPGNFGCTSKVFWNLYTGISAVFFTVVKITALVITTLPCIRNPIYPAVAQTVLFLVLSSFVLLFLPYRLRLANQITAAEVFSCCLCSLFSLVASILYNFEINKVLPLFIASMCIIPVACALGFLAVLFRYKRIVGKMSKITFAEDPSDLESMAITKTTADPKSSSYTFSWQVLLASVCVESSLSDPCLKSGILHFGVKKFPESFSLWLAYAEAIMSKDMQVANFCLQNSSKLIPKWFIPAQFNLFGLDRIRREQEQQTEETIIRQLISAAKYHGKALYYIHSFWTLLLGEYVGQRPLSRIVIKLEKTEKQCDELFERMLKAQKKPSSAVLRAYAEYLADVKQNFVQAQQLHAMAEAMETRHEEQNNAKQTLGRHQPMMQDNPTAQPIVAEFAISEVGDPEENAMLDNALDEANTFQQDELAQQEKIRNQLELSFRSHAFSRFSFSVYFMNFISIVVLVVSFALARTAFKQRQADFNLIATAGGMRSAELQGSYGTRTMQLVNSNMRYLDNFNMTTFGSDVVSSTLELESAAKDLFFHYDTSYPAVFEAWHNQDLQSINYIPLIDEIETLNTTLWLFISAYKAKVFDAVGFYNGETNAEEGQEAFLYVNSNGALQLWSGVWRLVTAYEERFHAQTTRTFVMTLCVLSSCALVPLLAFSLILLPSLYSLNRERLLVHQLFLQIPKASVSEICEKVTAKLEQKKVHYDTRSLEAKNSLDVEANQRWHQIKPIFTLGMLFLLVFLVILSAIALIAFLSLEANNDYMGRALEVNYAGSRRSLSLRLLTLIQDAIVDDSSVHSKDEIMQEFDSTITQLRNAHEWVKFGNKTLGLPGSVGRSVEQDSLLFDSLCEQYDQPQCMGLDELMGRYLEMAHELYKVQRFLKNFNLSLFLNFEDLQTNYLMPMLSTSKKIYVAEAPMIIEETNRKIAYIFAFFLPLIFVLFFLLIKPAMKKVENELHTTHQMLGMVPVHIIKNVPSLLSFVMKGRLMDKDFSHEAQERSRAIIMAAVDAVLELTDAGTIESMNSSGEHITGYAATQVVGKHFSVLLQDDDNTEKLCALLESNVEKMRHRLIGRERSNETSWSSSVLAKKLDGTAFPANATLSLFTVGGKIGCALFLRDTTPEQKHEELLQDEKRMYEELLFSVLPRQIAYRIRNGEQDIVESVPVATVMFADVVQFTPWSASVQPSYVIKVLNHMFSSWDNLLKKKYTHIEKIKTIGDCYFCAAGLFDKDARNSHSARAKDVVNFALDMIASLQQTEIRIRVGINTGPVFAGIVGDPSVKPTFDIFGSTVNVASRMESSSSPNTIQMTRATYELVFDSFEFDEQDVDIKGCGMMHTYTLKNPKTSTGTTTTSSQHPLPSKSPELPNTLHNRNTSSM